jgi:hypothetical protein
MTAENDLALRRALETAGVEFIDENGDSPGCGCEDRPRLKRSDYNCSLRVTQGTPAALYFRRRAAGPHIGVHSFPPTTLIQNGAAPFAKCYRNPDRIYT